MWDVVWTDPGRELVGERRARRDESRAKDGDVGRASLSSSTTSSRSSTAESAFARFRARGLKQPTSKASPLPSPASASGSTRSSVVEERSCSDESSLTAAPVVEIDTTTNDGPTATRGTRRRLAQIISSPSNSASSRFFDRRSPARSVFAEPLTPPRSPTLDSRPCTASASVAVSSVRRHPDLPGTPPRRPAAPSGVVDAGQPSSPRPWGPAPADPNMSRESATASLASASEARLFWTPSDFDAFVQDIKNMAASPPTVALAKLKELTATDGGGGEDQQQSQSQLEVDRLRWMFSVLLHLDVATPRSGTWKRRSRLDPDKVHNVLALYESKASASYLAGLYPAKRILHLSDKPLPQDALPNVQPLYVSDVAPAAFPIPPQLFEAVYAVSLPSLCSARELRGLISNVSSCLKPQGTLSLRIIDPLPCAETLGRRMRGWLEEHLMANLEKQGRCSRPTAQLPQWLGEVSLRAAGSTLTTAKFYATPESVWRLAKDPDPTIERMHAERKVKAELRSLVGRMLWREVWGEYVTADSWWWDDAACVDECLELGTFWEYHLIEAVKDG
ncbi:hypothetical protein GQ602_006115 [Ophiocordyceps camponoti-floridani]|uniref:Uncharacterized protein n=1 Tax=Ophiocordyceps camponoti-floridani TaxID=2030778 RepID=A0A8H4VBL3_9HYPO|nr:hypothetical protein GQ602_006115 [Ophiocordyceps camponoti-floridani]